MGKILEVKASINQPIALVWDLWTNSAHIINWNFAHESWCCPNAEVDFKEGGKFTYRMEARDQSFGFDFSGTYVKIETLNSIETKLDDDRIVKVVFEQKGDQTILTELFEMENENPEELQIQGWQAILDNFKNYAEKKGV